MLVDVMLLMRHNSNPVKASGVDIIIFITSHDWKASNPEQRRCCGKKIYFLWILLCYQGELQTRLSLEA